MRVLGRASLGLGLVLFLGALPCGRQKELPAQTQLPLDGRGGGLTVLQSERHGVDNGELYVMKADGSGQTRPTASPANDLHSVWSPDGARIVFMGARDGDNDLCVINSDRTGYYQVFVMNADGSDPVNLSDVSGGDYWPSWR